jgi:hypothetical protein
MSPRFEAPAFGTAAPDGGEGVMGAIGLELALFESGAQSEKDTCEHISKLVASGKALMRPACNGLGGPPSI